MGLEYGSILGISLIYIIKSNGPKIEPYETPNYMCSICEIAPLVLHIVFCFIDNLIIEM